MPYRSVNPATGEVVATYAGHTDAELQQALTVAHSLYQSDWSRGSRQRRFGVLSRVADVLDTRAEDLARILTQEMGKRISEARAEVRLSARILRFYATNAAGFLAPEKIDSPLGDVWVEYHPIGVIVAVEPWNFPYYQLARVAGPNTAIGNPVLVKHSSIVPRSALAFEKAMLDAGAPRGAWTNMFASAEQIASLIEDDRVQGVTLTGSEKAGGSVAAQAGKYLKKSVMELGGADVFVVLDDADVRRAAKAGADARLTGAGQVCNGAKRFLVHEKVAAAFLQEFTRIFESTKIGDPSDESVGLGPLCSVQARDDIAAQITRAVDSGATLHFGGHALEGPGAFLQPTILTHIRRDNPAYFEEFFGPVAQVYTVRDDEEIINLANDSHFGLSGAIFTANIERAKTLATRIETGSVWINTRSSTAPELPFGGVKRSGYGRELSRYGIKEWVNQKMVVVANS